MKRLTAIIAAMFLLSGCAFLQEKLCVHRSDMLAEAVTLLEKGNESAAAKLLEELSISKNPVAGVTDEALFRLSLLELRKHENASEIQAIQKRLTKLQTDYPSSQWARMSWPLTEYITQAEALRTELRSIRQKYTTLSKENRDLSNSNQQMQGTIQSLSKENREINQQIEKLKSLDIELEKKVRH